MSVNTLSNQTVTIYNPSGTRDKHGQPAFGAGTSAVVRFERVNKTIKTQERERDPIHATMGCPPTVTIQKGAKVVYQSETYRVMELAEAIDGSGNVHHRECNLQLWSYA